jgi:hypothetical protein
MTEEKIRGKEVSMPETGTITIERMLPSDTEEPETERLELEPGERIEVTGPDGFTLAYEANYGVVPEEESDE